GLGNYTIGYTDGTLTIDPKALDIKANDRNKTYGATVVFTGTEFTPTGLLNGNTVTSVTLTSAGAAGTASVTAPGPTYPITPSAPPSSGLGNYTIGYTDGTLTIDPKALGVKANDRNKTYGDALVLGTAAFTPTGLVNSDAVSSVTLTSAGAAATATVTAPGPTYPITPSAASGTGLGNDRMSDAEGTL